MADANRWGDVGSRHRGKQTGRLGIFRTLFRQISCEWCRKEQSEKGEELGEISSKRVHDGNAVKLAQNLGLEKRLFVKEFCAVDSFVCEEQALSKEDAPFSLPRMIRSTCLLGAILGLLCLGNVESVEAASSKWDYSSDLLRPFWRGDVMRGESVLFIRDQKGGKARASVLFPVREILEIRSSAGDVVYEPGRDYVWKPGSSEIVVPVGSRIVVSKPADLRRPANSQKYRLTHRDGNGEIMFGAKLEYHALQTSISYRREPGKWSGPKPRFHESVLPNVVGRLRRKEPVKILVRGDSISTGCNASGWADGEPFQPAYPELVRRHLAEHYDNKVEMENLSISGRTSRSGVTMSDQGILGKPDLVIIAFGMNDSAGVSVADFRKNTAMMIAKIRKARPRAEFILVATMLGNADWPRLNQKLFPQYRDALAELCERGVALADLTSAWAELLKRKKDWDLTGNGVNHPNDFGHRVYAQMITALLIPDTRGK